MINYIRKLIAAKSLPPAGESIKRSIDNCPWNHPFLTSENIHQFKEYSRKVWDFAEKNSRLNEKKLKVYFSVNLAQNMNKWSRLAQDYGCDVKLFINPQDSSAINSPYWEEFDGDYHDIHDGKGFLESYNNIPLPVSVTATLMDDNGLLCAVNQFNSGNRKSLIRLLAKSNSIRHESLMAYRGFYPYYQWASELAKSDVIYTGSSPYAAYFSGKPYCVVSVGGDLQFDCGRGDDLGKVMHLSFNAARFLFVSNPHTLGHSRRFGLTNGVYLPYPMDDNRYCPGEGKVRRVWDQKYGKGIYVLTTARLDKNVKGHDNTFFDALVDAASKQGNLKFVFLGWGESFNEFQKKLAAAGLINQVIILPPVGKKKLIDYYRSCDIVSDQFVYGYYGATALEAAAVAKPVIMKMRNEQYKSLYDGDIAPVENCSTPIEVNRLLIDLANRPDYILTKGAEMRKWLVRNHGEKRTVPLMVNMLQLAADNVALPTDIIRDNPLLAEETDEEKSYHASCFEEVQ